MDDPIDQSTLAEARAILARARRIVALTGAGISAESGIPTFRDALTSLWAKYRPEDLATPEAFLRDPKMVWDWYAWRRERVAGVQPNAGHRALAKLEADAAAGGSEFTLVTQNVDGLHHAAGSRRIHELHGNIRRVKCFDSGHPAGTWNANESPPRCVQCGSWLRPDVVWFGEMLPPGELEAATAASRECDVFLSIGTSGLVEPAASLAFSALGRGATVIEVNPDRTPLTEHATFAFRGSAGTVLPLLAA